MNSQFNSQILSGSNFAKIADVIYSEFISKEEYNLKKLDTHIVLFKTENYLLYKLTNFDLKKHQTIFCNNLVLFDLFKHLSKLNSDMDFRIITHQTDQLITQKIFNKKPKNVSMWYSINAGIDHSQLIPIPLGLANEFQDDYINPKTVAASSSFNKNSLSPNMYINFKISTNFKERKDLYKKFKNENWVYSDQPSLKIKDYVKNIQNNSFVLAPWGNGIDSHRFWEALYLGKIPITKNHITYKPAKNLPVLLVDNYDEINLDLLKNSLNNLKQTYSFEVLTLDYWNSRIKKDFKDTENTFNISENQIFSEVKKRIFNFKRLLQSKLKVVKFYLKKIKKVPLKIKNLFNQ